MLTLPASSWAESPLIACVHTQIRLSSSFEIKMGVVYASDLVNLNTDPVPAKSATIDQPITWPPWALTLPPTWSFVPWA